MFTGNTLNKKSAASQLNGTTGNVAAVNFEYAGNANIASLDTTVRGAAASLVQLNTGTYDVTFGVGNTITGSGGIEKLGAGILTLTGANSYTGGTTVSAGTLAGDTDSLQGPITNNAAVLFDQSTNGTYAGDMSGSGSLSKTGAGTLTLTGTNSYTGMTTVESGTLALGANQAYLKDLTLYGGATFDRSVYNHSLDNGSLTVRGEGATYAGDLSAVGATLNFIAPVTVSQALLTVSGNADISSSSVNVGLTGGTALPLGTQLTLIDASGSLTANNLSEGGGIMESGVTTIYGLALSPDPMTGTLTGTVISRIASGRSKALSEGFVSGLGLVSQGADLIAGQGLREAVRASRETGYGLAAFGGLAGGSLRYNSGSHVDLGSLSFLAGLSYGVDLASASLTLGAFFEYGNGSYDTYNSFSNAASVHGDGDLSHVGGGLLGRLDFPGAGPGLFYVEASGRAGGVRNDYGSSDLRDPQGRRAEYDSSSAYYGFHFGTGYVWNLTETASLDLYGKYFWTRQEGDSVILSTGDRVAFADADSSRLRLGGRLAWALNEYVSPYFGAAYEHEFDGRARATANGLVAIEAPSLGGNTGIGELGLTLKPSQSRPLSLDLGLQGYTGRKEGLTGSLQLRIEF
jgi:autotransporter-associated beta strand protein